MTGAIRLGIAATTLSLAILAATGLFTTTTTSASPLATEQMAAPRVTGPITGGRFGNRLPAGRYLGSDGRWSVTGAEQAAYETRMLCAGPPIRPGSTGPSLSSG
jgi:hypothetical protein